MKYFALNLSRIRWLRNPVLWDEAIVFILKVATTNHFADKALCIHDYSTALSTQIIIISTSVLSTGIDIWQECNG